MNNARRLGTAADILVAYAADPKGHGIAYASIASGNATRTVRLSFSVTPMPALEGREQGYAAIAAVGQHLKSRGFGRLRIRLGDAHVASDLNGSGSPPKALAMAYVRVRCMLHALGPVRLEVAEAGELADLARRAAAEVCLRVAA